MATSMLGLPDELLLDIALRLNSLEYAGVRNLKALSLTCHILRPIAQEALVRTASVSMRRIWKLIEFLGTRPILARSLTHLRLGQFDQGTYNVMKMANLQREIVTNENHQAYVAFLGDACPIANLVKWMDDGFRTDEAFCSFGVLAIICLSPGLRDLSISSNFLECLPYIAGFLNHETFSPDNPTLKQFEHIRYLFEKQLECLEITKARSISKTRALGGMYPYQHDLANFIYSHNLVKLARFQNLKHVIAPLSYLFDESEYMSIQETGPSHVLPRSLESIRIDMGAHHVHTWADWFGKLVENRVAFPHLKRVIFRFELNMPSMAWHMCSPGTRFGQEQLGALQRWKASGVTVKTEFGTFKFVEADRVLPWQRSDVYVEGDLITAIKRSLATTHEQLEKETVLMEGLGYITPR